MSVQNVEAEKTVLGSLLLDGELIKECRLTERLFFYARAQVYISVNAKNGRRGATD